MEMESVLFQSRFASLPKSAASRSAIAGTFTEERKESATIFLVEMHRVAQAFFTKQLEGTAEGKVARAIWKIAPEQSGDRSIWNWVCPSGGDVCCVAKAKYRKLLVESGFVSPIKAVACSIAPAALRSHRQ